MDKKRKFILAQALQGAGIVVGSSASASVISASLALGPYATVLGAVPIVIGYGLSVRGHRVRVREGYRDSVRRELIAQGLPAKDDDVERVMVAFSRYHGGVKDLGDQK